MQPGVQTNTHRFHAWFNIVQTTHCLCTGCVCLELSLHSALLLTQVHRFHVKGLFLSHVIQSHAHIQCNVYCFVSPVPTSALLWCTHSIHHFMSRVLQVLQHHFNTQLRKQFKIKHWWFFSPSSAGMYDCLCLTASCLLFCLHYGVTDVVI